MINTILSALSGYRVWLIGALGVTLFSYVYIIQEQRDNALEAQVYAENNVVLVTTEFDRLHSTHERLETSFKDREIYYTDTVERLVTAHEEEVARVIKVTVIKEKIVNVKQEDDGNLSNILSDTLDALRMYD